MNRQVKHVWARPTAAVVHSKAFVDRPMTFAILPLAVNHPTAVARPTHPISVTMAGAARPTQIPRSVLAAPMDLAAVKRAGAEVQQIIVA